MVTRHESNSYWEELATKLRPENYPSNIVADASDDYMYAAGMADGTVYQYKPGDICSREWRAARKTYAMGFEDALDLWLEW